MHQITDTLLMVRPSHFGFNPQTAESNAFQENDTSLLPEEIQILAVQEFDQFVEVLRNAGIRVIVVQDTVEPVKYDAVFPNNWITTHEDGTIITYPMFAPMRRLERNSSIIAALEQEFGYNQYLPLDRLEAENIFLEGTGSLILDRRNRIAYACSSPRTDTSALDKFCEHTGFTKVLFHAYDPNYKLIYHTNVMMALGETFVVVCLDTVKIGGEWVMLRKFFDRTQKEVIEISMEQMMAFAGNMLQVKNKAGETYLVMSEQAYRSLKPDQIQAIEKHTSILHCPLYTIEKYGGGSARCMMAEIFPPL